MKKFTLFCFMLFMTTAFADTDPAASGYTIADVGADMALVTPAASDMALVADVGAGCPGCHESHNFAKLITLDTNADMTQVAPAASDMALVADVGSGDGLAPGGDSFVSAVLVDIGSPGGGSFVPAVLITTKLPGASTNKVPRYI